METGPSRYSGSLASCETGEIKLHHETGSNQCSPISFGTPDNLELDVYKAEGGHPKTRHIKHMDASRSQGRTTEYVSFDTELSHGVVVVGFSLEAEPPRGRILHSC